MNTTILEQLRSTTEGLALCWLGNLSWLIHAEARLIAFDLDLDHDLRREPSPIPTEEIAPFLDVLFVTHAHGDHFNATTAGILMAQGDCVFVLPLSCEAKAQAIGIPETRIRLVQPRESTTLLNVRVETLRALHGDRYQAVYRHANLEDCGYLLTLAGHRLLQPGDSVLLQDHLELEAIDILFVSPTDHNMHIGPATRLVRGLAPDHIFPQHFGTYTETEENRYWTHGYPDELRAALPEALRQRYHKLSLGEVFVIPAEEASGLPPRDRES